MSFNFGLDFFERFSRSSRLRKQYFYGFGSIISFFQFAPEIAILMGYDNTFHAELNIIPITNDLKTEFQKLCIRSNIDPDSIVLSTWSRDKYKLIGASWIYKLFGLKSILCVPALYESSYTDRRSRGYSRLTVGRVKWKSSIGHLAETHCLPNTLEKCFAIGGQLAIHKYNLWLAGSFFCLATFITLLYSFSMFFIRKGFYLLIIPVPIASSLFTQGPLWSLYLRLETYFADSFLVNNFPELAVHGKMNLIAFLFFMATVKVPGNREGKLKKYFYENYRISHTPTINRLKRLDKCIEKHNFI